MKRLIRIGDYYVSKYQALIAGPPSLTAQGSLTPSKSGEQIIPM